MSFFRRSTLLFTVLLMALAGCRSAGEFNREPQDLISRSRVTFTSMMSDNQYPGLVDLVARAKAVIILPNLLQGAFLIGGRGGNAIMLARNEQGAWSNPAFYTLGGLSFGLQVGANASEMVIAVMTEKALHAILKTQVTLGGDAGLAIGELGKGVNAATGLDLNADMYAFARSEGLFVGASIQGSVISPRHTWNAALYGPAATPESVLLERSSTSSDQTVIEILAAMP
ncbi:MAG: lipid-binding SYLF domain-containing protein [Bdellovibrionales bacterium]